MTDGKLIINLADRESTAEALGRIAETYPEGKERVRRAVDFEILSLLQEEEIPGADSIEEKLKETIPGTSDPQNPDLYTVAASYDEEPQGVSLSESELEISHERLGSIARAGAGVTDLVIAAAVGGESVQAASVLEMGEKAMAEIEGPEAEATRNTLNGIVDRIVSVVPPPAE